MLIQVVSPGLDLSSLSLQGPSSSSAAASESGVMGGHAGHHDDEMVKNEFYGGDMTGGYMTGQSNRPQQHQNPFAV